MDKLQALLNMCFVINTQGTYTATFDLTVFNQIIISVMTKNKIDLNTILINQNNHQEALTGIESLKQYLL